jgi:hypothetical protein
MPKQQLGEQLMLSILLLLALGATAYYVYRVQELPQAQAQTLFEQRVGDKVALFGIYALYSPRGYDHIVARTTLSAGENTSYFTIKLTHNFSGSTYGLTYNPQIDCANYSSLNTQQYGTLTRIGDTAADVLAKNVVVDVCFRTPAPLDINQTVQLLFVPLQGSATKAYLRLDQATNTTQQVFP